MNWLKANATYIVCVGSIIGAIGAYLAGTMTLQVAIGAIAAALAVLTHHASS